MTGETLDAHAHSNVAHLNTRNVVGVVPGRKHPDDYILYTAHWDHLGVKPDVAGPDKIYNGAIDNGMGVSSILELGETFAHAKPRPQRSVAIICWTLEEQGLLGSAYFAEHPLWPLSHIVGGINLDANLPEGPPTTWSLVGTGASELEDVLADVLKTQNRAISPDPEPEKGHFYRSDHISLAQGRRADARSGRRVRSGQGRHGSRPGGARRLPRPTTITSHRTNLIRTGTCPGRSTICMRSTRWATRSPIGPLAELVQGQRVPRDPGQDDGGPQIGSNQGARSRGAAWRPLRRTPRPVYGCNSVALKPSRIRLSDAGRGKLCSRRF